MNGILDGKVAIVTGGGRGIGAATCHKLAGEGAAIAVFEQDQASGAATAEAVNAEGGAAKAYAIDITDRAAIADACRAVEADLGGIDILVNNAGLGSVQALENMPDEDWDRVIEVNLTGPFNCTKAVVPYMKKRGGGAVVIISSVAGKTMSHHGGINYTASKSGLMGFLRHASFELAAYGIRVNAVLPGPVLTPMVESNTTEEERDKTRLEVPLRRWIMPEDVADAVLFFAGPSSDMCTGADLNVDGGMMNAPSASFEEYFARRGLDFAG